VIVVSVVDPLYGKGRSARRILVKPWTANAVGSGGRYVLAVEKARRPGLSLFVDDDAQRGNDRLTALAKVRREHAQ